MEVSAWPGTNQRIFDDYMTAMKGAIRKAYGLLVSGGVCCVAIGDAAIRKILVPVHKIAAQLDAHVGFTLEEIVYRTTHYGVGNYAHSDRAGYHRDGNEKRDGELILRK